MALPVSLTVDELVVPESGEMAGAPTSPDSDGDAVFVERGGGVLPHLVPGSGVTKSEVVFHGGLLWPRSVWINQGGLAEGFQCLFGEGVFAVFEGLAMEPDPGRLSKA